MRRFPISRAMLAAAIMSVSACNSSSERPAVQYPPAIDLTCPAEPDAPTAEVLLADPAAGLRFDMAALLAGRACRNALRRTCQWHVERGAKVNCEESR